jgi:hypothetical protein
MAITFFPSLPEADTLELTFLKPLGGETALRLLVDSGFTGQSCFVLPENADDLAHAAAPASQAAGALQGTQRRVVVFARIEALAFRAAAIAILADTAALALPAATHGIVGLRFLRYFRRWGSEQSSDGTWQFFLENDTRSPTAAP